MEGVWGFDLTFVGTVPDFLGAILFGLLERVVFSRDGPDFLEVMVSCRESLVDSLERETEVLSRDGFETTLFSFFNFFD